MATVYPFHGYRYNPEKVSDLNNVVTQPYDKIDSKKQESYYQSSDYNIVRLILGKGEPGKNKYEKAAEYLDEWLDNDIIVQEDEACFYAYYQEYEVEGEKRIRKGFIGLGELEGEDGVKAHENTMEGPKADRLNLMRATEANFGHIFMLYSDSQRKIINLLNKVTDNDEPLAVVKDEDDNVHKVWKITDSEIMASIQKHMKDKTLYIADGHHRYQTAVNYRNECLEKGWKSNGIEGFNNRLMTFVNIDDPGMSILATHRLVYGIDNFDEDKLLQKAERDFVINKYNRKDELYNKMDEDKGLKHTFGFKASDGEHYYSMTLKDESIMDLLLPAKEEVWKNLDVVILHKAILERYLDIDEEALAAKENTAYVRYRDQALAELEQGDYQAVFLLNPTQVEEVKAVADKNTRMPQKSTDFYPKLLTGLVLNKLDIQK